MEIQKTSLTLKIMRREIEERGRKNPITFFCTMWEMEKREQENSFYDRYGAK